MREPSFAAHTLSLPLSVLPIASLSTIVFFLSSITSSWLRFKALHSRLQASYSEGRTRSFDYPGSNPYLTSGVGAGMLQDLLENSGYFIASPICLLRNTNNMFLEA